MSDSRFERASADAAPAARLRARLAADDPLIWVTAGDSVAQGARWTAGQRDYAQLLEERVRFELERSSDVFCRTAVSGWRIGDVFDSLDSLDRLRPDIVSIGVGINDANLGPAHQAAFRRTYQEVLTHLSSRDTLVIVQVPNTVQTSAEPVLRDSLPSYVESIREIGRRSSALVVDHFQVWSDAGDSANAEWMADSLHPNARGHRVLARTLFEACDLWDEAAACCQLTVVEPFAGRPQPEHPRPRLQRPNPLSAGS